MATTTTFDYRVVDGNGKQVRGKLDAANEGAAVAALRQQGSVPLEIHASGTGLRRELTLPGFGPKVRLKDLAIFTRQFATMVNSGLTLLRSLAILEQQTTRPALQRAVAQVSTDIDAGGSLSGAMAKQDRVFPAIMVAMIRAGETGGFLDDALMRVAGMLEKDAALRGKIKSAMTYPVIVLMFAGLMITGVLVFIVPIFEKMFAQFGSKLPLPTLILVNVSHSLTWLGPLLLVVTVIAVTIVKRRLRSNPDFRLAVDKLKLRLPVFGSLLAKIAISRFARNLGTLLGVGVPVMQALDVVGATTGNAVITQAAQDVQRSVRAGRTMSAPLANHSVFPAMVAQMMEVGEESGQISAMLDKVADFYDREVDQAAEQLTAAIEPVMVVFMGVIVGGMVICLYLPMFTVYQHIQGAS